MAGTMRKMAVYLGLVEDDNLDYVDEHDDYDDPRPVSRHEPQGYSSVREVPQPTRSSAASRPVSTAPATRGNLATDTAVHADVRHEVRPADPVSVSDLYRITTLHPRSYNDARRIGEEFRDGVPVIMNLSDMDDAEAKRLVDFAAGLAFALRGSFDKVATKVFLLSPADIDVSAEERRRIAEAGFYAYQ